MKKIYLACPYTHHDNDVVRYRVEMANKVAGQLMMLGNCVFSPLSHSHPIAETMSMSNFDHNFWLAQDLPILVDWADEMYVLCMDGWMQSFGIHIEMVNAKEFDIPIRYLPRP